MAELKFTPIAGSWHCGNDYKNVALTKVTGPPGVLALLYNCNVNVDYDGSPTAYGPPGMHPDDDLRNAGSPGEGWYGVISYSPEEVAELKKRGIDVLIDQREGLGYMTSISGRKPVRAVRYPVIQQAKNGDPKPGYYVSCTPHNKGPEYKQTSYVDASTVPFGALSGQLKLKGNVTLEDFGLGVRHNQFRQSGIFFGDSGGAASYAVAECSQRVFKDLGGTKKPGHYPDNNFYVSWIVFPGSRTGDTSETAIRTAIRQQLGRISQASNSQELPLLMAFSGQPPTGQSGLHALEQYRSKGAKGQLPKNYLNILAGLTAWGYRGDPISNAVNMIADFVSAS